MGRYFLVLVFLNYQVLVRHDPMSLTACVAEGYQAIIEAPVEAPVDVPMIAVGCVGEDDAYVLRSDSDKWTHISRPVSLDPAI